MSNEKIELTAGELSSRVSTAEDKNNWAQIAERLFNQIIMNRSLILICIQSRAPFHPKQPDNLDELMVALRATDNDDNSQFWCDERIKLGIHSSKIAPANMAFSYHLIFESIAFEIAACISMRTDHRLQQELSLQYPQDDGEEKAKEINQWYRQLHQAMYDQVAVLVKSTLPYKMPNYPVLDFMGYIERFEHDKGLFSAEWLERPQDLVLNPSIETLVNYSQHSFEKAYPLWVRMFTHPLARETWPFIEPSYITSRRYHSRYYQNVYCTGDTYGWELSKLKCSRSSLHVNDLNDPMISAAIKTLRYLMMQRMPHCTAKEILFLVMVLSYDIEKAPDEKTPLFMASIRGRHLYHHQIEYSLPPAGPLPAGRIYAYRNNGIDMYSVKSPDEQDMRDIPYTSRYDYYANVLRSAAKNGHAPMMDGAHFYNILPENKRPLSLIEKNELREKIPALLHALIVKHETNIITEPTKEQIRLDLLTDQECEKLKTTVILKKIHDRIANSPTLFEHYCLYLLNQPSIELPQVIFLERHFKYVNEITQNAQQKQRLLTLCGPIWVEKIHKLEVHLKLDHSNARPGFFVMPSSHLNCFNHLLTQRQPTTWTRLGWGSFNIAYRSDDGRSVFKVMHAIDPEEQIMDSCERSVRLWNEINPTLLPPAEIQREFVDGNWELGWVCPYVDGRQSTDEEIKIAVIDIFNRTGRIVVDATAEKNFITTPAGAVICVDIGWALRLDKENKVNRQVSLTSFTGWNRFDSGIFTHHYSAYPQTINTINALLFIKSKKPDVSNVEFLKRFNINEMKCLSDANHAIMQGHLTTADVDAALELFNFYYTKNQCLTALKQLVDSNYQASKSKIFGLFRNTLLISPQSHTVCIQLLQKIRAAKSIEEIYQHVICAGYITGLTVNKELSTHGIIKKCMLFIAKQKPEIVNFRSSIYESVF